jgi:hypothetical protein
MRFTAQSFEQLILSAVQVLRLVDADEAVLPTVEVRYLRSIKE